MTISLILPSLNVSKYIELCLKSALGQTISNMEIICVDAGSTDGTLEIIQQYKARCDQGEWPGKKIKLEISPKRSYGYQVNLGIEKSTGEYLAILETDDYIEPNMYELLLTRANGENLDYVKCEYYSYIEHENGDLVFWSSKTFNEENQQNYNEKNSLDGLKDLLVADYTLWRGIYKTEFIKNNKIRLSESPGAAYQDQAFIMQTIMYAKKAMYIKEPLYNYCTSRAGASSYSLKGLNNYQYEYKRIKDLIFRDGNEEDVAAFYHRMANSFYSEYLKILPVVNFDAKNNALSSTRDWFKNELNYAVQKQYINEGNFGKEAIENLNMIFSKPKDFAIWYSEHYLSEMQENDILKKVNLTKNDPIIVFGAGKYGAFAARKLILAGANLVGITDNNEKMWAQNLPDIWIAKESEGVPSKKNYVIESPNEAILKAKNVNASIVVISKNYVKEIVEQLKTEGIDNSKIRILDY